MYATFIGGTLSWLDPNNNKAFLSGDISLTLNGISIYYAARTSNDPGVKALAADIYHAPMPVGPVGRHTELNPMTPAFVFKYTKYPNAAREYLRFMLEKDQYEAWQKASIGYAQQPLKAYRSNPVWTVDPKHTAFRDIPERTLDNGYAGALGTASAGAHGGLCDGEHGRGGGLGRRHSRRRRSAGGEAGEEVLQVTTGDRRGRACTI